MSLPKMTTPVNNISLLDDLPNAVGGLSAAELKARFDKAGGDIQTFLNETLIPAIEQMGVDEGAARDAAIQAAIDALELDTTVENLQKAIVAAESRSKEYADTKDAANLAAAKQYADDKAAAARSAAERAAATDATSKANAALLSAKNYANQQDAVTLLNAETAAKQYADKQDAATLTAAKEYTDGKIPSKLPNPQKLKFTGAATGEYDGSAEKTINIPTGGGDVPAVLGNLAAQIGDAAAGTIPVYAGDEAWVVKKLMDTYTGQESDTDLAGSLPTSEWVKKLAEAIANGYKLTEADKKAIAALVAADGTEFALSDFPTALKNPNALTFTGAATGTYDGSAALTVNIPAGGSSGSGGALKAMSAVGGYIGIPAADLPENGVVWMCFGSGDSTELYTGTVTIQDAGIAVNDMLVITNGTVNPLDQVSWVSDGLAIYGLSTNDYRGVYQVVGAGGGSSWTLHTSTTIPEDVAYVQLDGLPEDWLELCILIEDGSKPVYRKTADDSEQNYNVMAGKAESWDAATSSFYIYSAKGRKWAHVSRPGDKHFFSVASSYAKVGNSGYNAAAAASKTSALEQVDPTSITLFGYGPQAGNVVSAGTTVKIWYLK